MSSKNINNFQKESLDNLKESYENVALTNRKIKENK